MKQFSEMKLSKSYQKPKPIFFVKNIKIYYSNTHSYQKWCHWFIAHTQKP